jgi:hypothetical protein
MLVFAWNVVGTALKARRIIGIMIVTSVNIVPLVLLYLIVFHRSCLQGAIAKGQRTAHC